MKINRIFLLVVFILLVAVSYAYAGKVSQLPEATTMGSTDLIYKSEAGTTSKKITWANILSSIVSGTSGSTLQPYDADLVTLATPTAWRLFYSNGSQAIIELALGSDGTYLKSNGATSAPTWATPGGSGDVSKVGTPANYEFGIWTGDGTLKGLAVTGSKVMCTDANGQPIACTNLTDLAFSSYVDKALFDANTILAATSDNTPAAITIAEQRVLGRITSGNIAALTLGVAAGNVAQWPTDPAAHTLFGFDNTTNTYKNITIGSGLNFDQPTSTLTSTGGGTPTAITVANEATDTTCFPLFVTAATGDLGPKTVAGLTLNSNTGMLGATGITVGASGVILSKQSGVAGRMALHEANSTDTHTAGFRGPASITGDGAYEGQLPNARATSANMVLAWTNAGESGDGTAATPYVQTMSWADLDDYVTKALFDANTIIAATSDNTPAAVTIAEQTVIGRVTSGNIDDLAIDSDLASVSANNDTIPSAKAVKNRVQYKSWSFDPDAVCDGAVDRLFLMSSHGGQGIIITQWKLSFEADPTTEADLDLKRADAWIGVANSAVMDVLDTTNGASSESTPANINGGAAIAEGKVIYLEFGTAYTETTHQIIFEMWYYEVGN